MRCQMVVYIHCVSCGKVVDEFEKECFWCKRPATELTNQIDEEIKVNSNDNKQNISNRI